jgi:DNA-directed RNA polymerase
MKVALPVNIIHSLDASIIHQFAVAMSKKIGNHGSFLCIHDSILLPPCMYDVAQYLLRSIYINLFHKDVVDN